MEVQKLTTSMASRAILNFKSIFARHKVPTPFVSDNSQWYDCQEVIEENYAFWHIMNRTLYLANGEVGRAVKTNNYKEI